MKELMKDSSRVHMRQGNLNFFKVRKFYDLSGKIKLCQNAGNFTFQSCKSSDVMS